MKQWRVSLWFASHTCNKNNGSNFCRSGRTKLCRKIAFNLGPRHSKGPTALRFSHSFSVPLEAPAQPVAGPRHFESCGSPPPWSERSSQQHRKLVQPDLHFADKPRTVIP